MKIIAHKNRKYDYFTFLKETINNSKISGISFDILMTKDKKIIIYFPSGNYLSSIDTLQSNNYNNLINENIMSLEDVLKVVANSNQKIILNFLPIVSPPTDEKSLINLNKLNEEYVLKVNNIVKNFPNLKFYLCSAYDNLVFQIKRLNQNNKVGFIITNLSTNYIDVDFYVFTTNMIDRKIIMQQLALNKEVMIYLLNCDDIDMLLKYISAEPFIYNVQNIFREVYFINNYPEIFWNIFNKKIYE